MSNIELAQDQNGRTVQGVFAQIGDARNFPCVAAVQVPLVPGRIYEVSADGGLAFLQNDGATVVTAANGRFATMPVRLRATPERPFLSVLGVALMAVIAPATICTVAEIG